MIVDLIRNDLSRIAAPGSVKTPSLFDIETYPTLHQLTSTVTARLDEGRTAVDVLAAMFPCGSVTGAPKIRAMDVIAATEQEARGVRSEEHTSELQSLMRISSAVFCLKKKKKNIE